MKRKHFTSLRFDRLIYGSSIRQVVVLFGVTFTVFLFLCCIVLIFRNHWQFTASDGMNAKDQPFWQVFYFFSDPGNQMSMGSGSGLDSALAKSQTPSLISRILGAIISLCGSIFLGGLLISTINNIIERRVELCRNGLNYYNYKNHVVVIGSDQMIQSIVNQLCERGEKRIVILTSEDVEKLRRWIYANLKNKDDKKRIVVNYGIRDSENDLVNISITSAKEVFVLGDSSEFDEIECFHDSLNVQCLKQIAHLCELDGVVNLPCHVSFEYKTTYNVFQYADLQEKITKYIKFEPFNLYELWAQKVFVIGSDTECNISYKNLDYFPITSEDSDNYVHLIIIGLSRMGEALALQAAHIAHFPNYKRKKTRITIIDQNAHQEMYTFKQKCGELFEVSHSEYIDIDECEYEDEKLNIRKHSFGISQRYRHLVADKLVNDERNFIDVEWTFINGSDSHPVVRTLLEQYADDNNAMITVAVCLNVTNRSLRSAMHLPTIYYEKDIPILVQQRKTSSIVDALTGEGLSNNEKSTLLYKNLKPFGMVYNCYDLKISILEKYSKRINYSYNCFFSNGCDPLFIDNVEADLQWNSLKTTKRWSNKYAAASIPTKLRCVGVNWNLGEDIFIESFTEKQIDILSVMEHNRWNVEELLLGYRPVEREEDEIIESDVKKYKKQYKNQHIHYDIRPYESMKEDQNGVNPSVYDKVIIRSLPLICSEE